MNDFDNLATEYAPGWRPEEGDKLIGIVTDLSQGYSGQSESNYPIVTVHDETKDEDIAVHCFHFVLGKKMRELKPKVGERIGIIYKGQVPTKDGKRMVSVYNVKVEGRGADIWGDNTPRTEPPIKDASEEDDAADLPF